MGVFGDTVFEDMGVLGAQGGDTGVFGDGGNGDMRSLGTWGGTQRPCVTHCSPQVTSHGDSAGPAHSRGTSGAPFVIPPPGSVPTSPTPTPMSPIPHCPPRPPPVALCSLVAELQAMGAAILGDPP